MESGLIDGEKENLAMIMKMNDKHGMAWQNKSNIIFIINTTDETEEHFFSM